MSTSNKITVNTDFSFPSTTQLEIRILSELLNDSFCMQDAAKILNESMFADDRCKALWKSMLERYNKRLTIDLVTALSMTDRDFLVNEVIPASQGSYSASIDILEHASVLKQAAANRVAYSMALKILKLSSSRNLPYSDLLAASERLYSEVKGFLNESVKSSAITDIVNELAEDIEKTQVNREQGKSSRIPTGFKTLDTLTYSGFAPGNLVILAARPSVGKTAVMLQMALAASSAGFKPSIFNLEMGNKELAQRMIVGTGYVSQSQIAHGEVDWSKMEKAIEEVTTNKMYLFDDKRTIEDISTQIVLDHHQGMCDIAFVDYLGLMATTDKKPLYQAISDITKKFKQLAKDCEIPIILLCQLNRNSAIENRAPQLSDLRDSGSIEQDADIVLLLEREGNNDIARKHVDMWVRKNRQGRAGDIYIELDANDSFTVFSDNGLKAPE